MGGFRISGEQRRPDGSKVYNPEGKELVRHLGTTIERPMSWQWPAGKDFIEFDSSTPDGKAWIDFLRNSSRCRDKVGPIRTATYYERDVQAEIMAQGQKSSRMAKLMVELPILIGQFEEADAMADKIRSTALAIGINGHDTKSPQELWTQCMNHITLNPNAVEKAIGNSDDNLFKSRWEAWKKSGMLSTKGGDLYFFPNPTSKESGEEGVNLGKPGAVFQKLKARSAKEYQDLYGQMMTAADTWNIKA